MADVNANIGVNIDTSAALAQLKSLQRQISQFHTSISKSSESAAIAQKSLQKNLLNSVNAIGAFSAELRTVKTSAESFTASLEGNKFSMREYFRYAGASTRTFGRLFKSEFDTIGKVAEERVKRLQTQYIKLGRDTNGAMQALAITPTSLNMNDYATKTAMAAQKQALFNQLMKQGSTNLLNFGKNTQWAGRQLMVGFTIPLSIVGSAATKTFMEMEAQALKFKKVYGDLFTPQEETQQALDNITELGKQFTKYGIAVSQTVGLAAEAAAAGFQGLDLQRQTTEATRLSVLGQIDSQKALETTIALQNAFGMSSENLAGSIDFLNAVENQTVVSLDDITTAIPKVAPVIQQLGGDVKDLTFFIAAMKEGGINASEGANALKSGLAALINPTGRASAMLKQFGINATDIVTKNRGNLKATVIEFATALNQLDPLNRAQAIEQMFGKFQFARLSTLFANVAKDGNQAARVLDLANSSVEQLASLSEKELGMTAESSMNKFKKTVEDLKVALIPVGQAFLEAVTPILEFVGNILEKFGNLSSGTKKVVTLITLGIAGLGPIFLMTFGLLANLLANAVKGAMILRNGYLRLTGQSQILGEQTQYLTMEQIEAAAAAHSLDQSHARLTQQFTAEASAVTKLIAAYQQATAAGQKFMLNNPGMMLPGARKGYANGVISVPGSGKGDTVPAMLTPGEAVIPAAMAKKYAPLIQGMIAGNIPGYKRGKSISDRTSNVPIYPDIAVRYQDKRENQSQRASVPNIAEILGPLTARVGEARGLGFGQQAEREYPKIIEQYRPLAEKFIENVKIEFDRTAGTIKDESERLAKAWQVGGASVQSDISKVSNSIDSNTIKQAFGIAPDSFGTVAGNFRGSHGFGGRTNRFTEGNIPTSYTDPRFKRGSGAAYEMISGAKPSGDLGHIFDLRTRAKMGMPTTVPLQELLSSPNTSKATANELRRSIAVAKANAGEVGSEVGSEAIRATSLAAGTASPSKKTIRIGQDIARGLEIGMTDRQDNVAKAGSSLATAAIGGTQSGRNRPKRAPGTPKASGINLSSVTANMPIDPNTKQKVIENAKATETATQRMQKLDRSLMGASFAVSSLSGIASMSGGKLGEMSGTISKVTGALFALQAVTGLLTQSNMLQLATNRAGNAGLLVGNVATKKMALNTTLFSGGIQKLLPNLLRFGGMIAKFLGPVGLAITAFGATVSIIKRVNAARERERLAIYGLSEAIKTTTSQVKVLGDFFGVVPKKLPFDIGQREIVKSETRTQRESLKDNTEFQKEFKNTIESLRTATNEEAKLVFSGLALDLKAQGFASDQVQVIVDALREESSQTDVVLDVKSLSLSEESLNSVKNSMAPLLLKLNEELKKPMETVDMLSDIDVKTAEAVKPIKKLSKEATKELATVSTFISQAAKSASGMFELSLIDGKTYEATLSALLETTKGLDEAQRKLLLSKVFENLKIGAEALNGVLGNSVKEMRLLALLSAGILSKDSKVLEGLSAPKGTKEYQNALIQLNRLYGKMFGSIEKFGKEAKKKGFLNATTGGEKSALQTMQEKITALNNQSNAYIKLRAAGYNAETAAEMAADSLIAAGIAAGTVKYGTKEWKDLGKELTIAKIKSDAANNALAGLDQQKLDIKTQLDAYSKLIEAGYDAKTAGDIVGDINLATLIMNTDLVGLSFEEALKKINKVRSGLEKISNLSDPFAKQREMMKKFTDSYDLMMDKFRIQEAKARKQFQPAVDQAKAAVEEIQAKINAENTRFDKLLAPLQSESEILSNTLSIIDYESQKINDKYDMQANALQEISDINSEIANQQEQQLTLADALSQGDISAAAVAAQNMRASAAQNALGQQSKTLDAARKKELDSLVVNGMTRAQIEERQYQISQKIYAIEQDRKISQAALNLELEKANKDLVDAEKLLSDALKTIEDQKNAWEDAKLKVDELENSVLTMNISLAEQLELVKSIAAAWASVNTGGGGGGGFVTKKDDLGLTEDELKDLIGYEDAIFRPGAGMGFAKGGLVPKYFANGGLSRGTDTVPAMLTPGEFVMSKSSVDKYGPMLSAMNSPSFKMPQSSSYTSRSSGSNSIVDNSSAMYNYNIGITVPQSNASSGDIANAVISQIKYIDAQRIRGQR